MDYLNVITINEDKKWDHIVRSFKKYDVCYLSGYAKAFQLHGEGEPLLFYYDDGDTRGINVVMKRDIANTAPFIDHLPKNTWFDLSTPYGYGGFLIEGDNYNDVNIAYVSYCKEKGFISEFVRFHLFNKFQPYYNGIYEVNTRNVVRDLELPLDEIVMDFEHRARKSLKKALKNELEVEIDANGKRLDDFLDIYYGTMVRNNANENYSFSSEFFNAINELKNNYVYIHILFEGKVIATELVLYGPENCYSFLGGTNKEYFYLQPNTLLKYEIIKWAKENGLKRFILGGGYGNDDGIFKYKKGFAPNGIYDFYVGKEIFDEVKYRKLVEMKNHAINTYLNNNFFPIYRA